MFSIAVRRDGGTDAPIRVLHATVLRPGFRHRLTFTSNNQIDEVLDPMLADRLRPYLTGALAEAPTRMDRPSEEIALPGLILGDLTIIAGRPKGAQSLAMLRFTYFIGGIQTAFAARTGFDRPTLAHREALGLRALDDVARPLLDMAGALSAFPDIRNNPATSDGLAKAMSAVESQASDLEFYAGLLRRYVRDCDPANLPVAAPQQKSESLESAAPSAPDAHLADDTD
ncbi:MAG: hypothetical protein AAGF30_00860 [Pseudomonadota bacterium]